MKIIGKISSLFKHEILPQQSLTNQLYKLLNNIVHNEPHHEEYVTMDLPELPLPTLQAIFLHPLEFIPTMTNAIVEWNHTLQPSFNVVKNVITSYLADKEQGLFVEDVPGRLKMLHDAKCPKNFMRAYLAIIKNRMEEVEIQINWNRVVEGWHEVPIEVLEYYIDTFGLSFDNMQRNIELIQKVEKKEEDGQKVHSNDKINITDKNNVENTDGQEQTSYTTIKNNTTEDNTKLENGQQDEESLTTSNQYNTIDKHGTNTRIIPLDQYLSLHIDLPRLSMISLTKNNTLMLSFSSDYPAAFHHISMYSSLYPKYLIETMSANKQASRAADYIKALKLNPDDYPIVSQRLCKNTARYFLRKHGWQHAEDIFEEQPEALACVIEDLLFKEKHNEALSIWHRNKDVTTYINKDFAIEFFKQYEHRQFEEYSTSIIFNTLFEDIFGPSDKSKYFSLSEFDIKEQDIIWVDNDSPLLKDVLREISQARIIGIDTESVIGMSKLELESGAAIIQIATLTKVFIFDGYKCNNELIRQCLIDYFQGQGLTIGHAFNNDLGTMLHSFGFTPSEISEIKLEKVIDIWKLFKSIYPDRKYSNLGYICETVLGKEVCKVQTMTNWRRRPLRKNQLHYAAMDAYIVLKIYHKLNTLFGEQMIDYYCSFDSEI